MTPQSYPRGIEVLLKKATVDPKFREQLLHDSEEAARLIGLDLEPLEVTMLRTTSADVLTQIIDNMEVPHSQRRVFLGKAAAAMLAVLTGTSAALAGQPTGKEIGGMGGSAGIGPDIPSNASYGIRPDDPSELTVPQRVLVFLEEYSKIPRSQWKPATAIPLTEKNLPRFRQAIYKEFDVRMPAKTLKTLNTVKKLTTYIAESLEGYDEAKEE